MRMELSKAWKGRVKTSAVIESSEPEPDLWFRFNYRTKPGFSVVQ
jgi:hypothetical protein